MDDNVKVSRSLCMKTHNGEVIRSKRKVREKIQVCKRCYSNKHVG